jgi:hypothetical protein
MPDLRRGVHETLVSIDALICQITPRVHRFPYSVNT